MANSGPRERARENLTGIVSTLVTGIWLAALFTGQDWWLGFMLFGYVVIVPLVALLFGDESDRLEWWDDWRSGDEDEADVGGPASTTDADARADPPEATTDEALATLRARYARGELTEEQFERKLERVLETETVEGAVDRRERRERLTEVDDDW